MNVLNLIMCIVELMSSCHYIVIQQDYADVGCETHLAEPRICDTLVDLCMAVGPR